MKKKEQEEERMLLVVPKDAWETLEETLIIDAESSAFDKDLRKQIKEALDKIKDARVTIVENMKEEAKGLLDPGDPPGTNPEYERGMCELIARVVQGLGLSPDETCVTANAIAKEIGAAWEEKS